MCDYPALLDHDAAGGVLLPPSPHCRGEDHHQRHQPSRYIIIFFKGLVECCHSFVFIFCIIRADIQYLYVLLVEYPLVVLMASAR